MIDLNEIARHIQDAPHFHLPHFLGGHTEELPTQEILGYEFQLTKYMVIEVFAGVLMMLVFFPMAWKMAGGKQLKGRFWNFWEAILVYLRDHVVRPAIGDKKDADPYLPFLWTVFFFVLFCNVFGMVPWFGSPTGSIAVTGVLALCSFGVVVGSGFKRFGPIGYWTSMVPPMDLPVALGIFLKPMILVIEILGLLIKHAVLAIRLVANMFAGHLVLAVLLSFIAAAAETFFGLWLTVTVSSVVMSVALSMLELFVAFLQAYIFTFLSAVLIGMAIHPH
jgi:F-type H+-transporting ATPase subunit a